MSEEADVNNLIRGIPLIEELSHHAVYIGALLQIGDRSIEYMQMIVGVNENGATIKPKNGRYLTIPMPIAGKRKATEIDGLFFHLTSNGKPALAKADNGKLFFYYLLVNEVRIPARSFLGNTMIRIKPRVRSMAVGGINDILGGRLHRWRPILNAIGMYVTREVKRTIARKSSPPNAAITVANKGFNNPLVDTGAMQRSIYWRVI